MCMGCVWSMSCYTAGVDRWIDCVKWKMVYEWKSQLKDVWWWQGVAENTFHQIFCLTPAPSQVLTMSSPCLYCYAKHWTQQQNHWICVPTIPTGKAVGEEVMKRKEGRKAGRGGWEGEKKDEMKRGRKVQRKGLEFVWMCVSVAWGQGRTRRMW